MQENFFVTKICPKIVDMEMAKKLFKTHKNRLINVIDGKSVRPESF